MDIWRFPMVGLPGRKCSFSATGRELGTTVHFLELMGPHDPLRSAHLYRSSSRGYVEDAANSKRELRDWACERADAAPSFKPDVWRHFGLAVSGNEKRWQTTRKRYADTAGLEVIHTYGTLKLRVKRLQLSLCLINFHCAFFQLLYSFFKTIF